MSKEENIEKKNYDIREIARSKQKENYDIEDIKPAKSKKRE